MMGREGTGGGGGGEGGGWGWGCLLQQENPPLGLGLVAHIAISLPGSNLTRNETLERRLDLGLCIAQG